MISCVVLTLNRVNNLRMCLKAIRGFAKLPTEIIVVDNGSTDETKEFLETSGLVDQVVYSDNSLGVCARNYGFELAKGKIIVQIDDDVIVHNNWDCTIVNNLNGAVGAVGVQGAYVNSDWSGFDCNVPVNGLCDVLTGYCWAFKNEGWRYDERFAPFWHEESELQLRMSIEKGYRKKKIPMICTHNCQRNAPIDWAVHDRNLNYIKDKYKYVYTSERASV